MKIPILIIIAVYTIIYGIAYLIWREPNITHWSVVAWIIYTSLGAIISGACILGHAIMSIDFDEDI